MKLLRNYIIALGVVVVLTVAFAAMATMGLLTDADQAVVEPKDPLTVDMNEAGTEDLARLLELAVRNATPTQPPSYLPVTTTSVPLQTRTEGGVLVNAYSLHVVRMIDRDALLEDLQTGEFYQLSAGDFSRLLSHKAFSDLPDRRVSVPGLTVQSDDGSVFADLPATKTAIFSCTADGSFRPLSYSATEETGVLEMTVEQAAQRPKIAPSRFPDAWSLTVTSGDTTSLTQSRVQESELYFPSGAGTHTYTLTAHWDLSEERDWYGDVTYAFEIRITEPSAPEPLPEDPAGETADP